MVLKTTGLDESEQHDDKDEAAAEALVGDNNTDERTAATALPSGSHATSTTVDENSNGNEMGTDRQTTDSAELDKALSRFGQQEIMTGTSSSSPVRPLDTCKPSISWPKRTQGGGNAQSTAQSSCSAEGGSPIHQVARQPGSQQVNDSEMAIVSESMAHASLSTPSANAVSERAAAKPTAVVIPTAASASAATSKSPKPNEGKPKKKKRSPPPVQPGQSSGRWTHAEHEAFLEGLKVFGREWKKVAVRIPTRTSAQVRSHAQKYFSKLARDEQLMNQEGQAFEAAAAAAAAGSSASTASAGSSAAAEAMAAAQSHPPEVQRHVERILSNPERAQRDVEDTLRALRERYEQLQQRLRDHQAFDRRQGSPAHRVEEEKEESNNDNNQHLQQASNNQNEQQNERQQQQQQQQQRSGKRRRGESGSGDESSLASSTLSSLGNEELIALSVLGGSLPNGGGAAPPEAATTGAAQAPTEASGNGSSNSSLESNSTKASSSSNPIKRKREDEA